MECVKFLNMNFIPLLEVRECDLISSFWKRRKQILKHFLISYVFLISCIHCFSIHLTISIPDWKSPVPVNLFQIIWCMSEVKGFRPTQYVLCGSGQWSLTCDCVVRWFMIVLQDPVTLRNFFFNPMQPFHRQIFNHPLCCQLKQEELGTEVHSRATVRVWVWVCARTLVSGWPAVKISTQIN